MAYYSEFHHEERRSRGPFDLYWDTNHYGLLALRNRETYSRIENRKENRAKFCKVFCYGPAYGFLAFLVFMTLFWGWKHFESMIDSPTPEASTPSIVKLDIFQLKNIEKIAAKNPEFNPSISNSKSCQAPRIVAYYKAWDSQVITENQLQKLTHVIFKYVKIDKNGTLGFGNNLEEMKFEDLKEKVKKLRNGNFEVKIMVSLELDGDIVKKIHPKSISSFLDLHNLDGIDIDWRHPTPEDIENQVKFINNLKKSITPKKSIISMTVSGLEWNFKYRMNLKSLSESIDFFNIFSMDYYTGNLTGPPSPLYSGIGDFRGFNVDKAMKEFACEIQNPEKLNMGVPFYGFQWNNVSKIEDQDIWKSGNPNGYIPWRILSKNPNFKLQKWQRNSMTPWIFDSKESKFLGFENQKSLEKKMGYLRKKNLGGVMIESIGDDDEMGSLLDTVVGNLGCQNVENYKCLKI